MHSHNRSCSCGHQFSMLFTMPYHHQHICPYASSSSSSSSVDCTLSLATPSTRLLSNDSRFCWDFLHNASRPPPPHKTIRGGGIDDSLLARRCANCDTTSTPLWRNGPRGPKSLCNACGIRFKKEERRANAATTAAGGGVDGVEGYDGNMWMHPNTQPASHKVASCYSSSPGEFRLIDDVDDRDSTLMSWRLNVTDRAGLVRDFTRY